MKKKDLKISAFLLSLAFLIPSTALARHKKSHQNNQNNTQDASLQKKDRTVLGSALGFGATAGVIGGGKWVGALSGWSIGKGIEHRKNKKNNKAVRKRKTNSTNEHKTTRKHAYAY